MNVPARGLGAPVVIVAMHEQAHPVRRRPDALTGERYRGCGLHGDAEDEPTHPGHGVVGVGVVGVYRLRLVRALAPRGGGVEGLVTVEEPVARAVGRPRDAHRAEGADLLGHAERLRGWCDGRIRLAVALRLDAEVEPVQM